MRNEVVAVLTELAEAMRAPLMEQLATVPAGALIQRMLPDQSTIISGLHKLSSEDCEEFLDIAEPYLERLLNARK